jgi:hypothetical protein
LLDGGLKDGEDDVLVGGLAGETALAGAEAGEHAVVPVDS